MIVYETKSSIKALLYLMAVDGNIDRDELENFGEIGEKLDRKNFDSYKDEIIESIQKQISSKDSDDDYYDVILEGLDSALRNMAMDDDRGVTGRLLVWNMVVIAFSNKEYDAAEKRLIAHVARISDVPKDVLLEMEQSMQAAMAVQGELEWIQNSERPYGEVRPVVDELENRLEVVQSSITALIEDEVELDDSFEDTPGVFDKAKDAVTDAMAPVLEKAGEKVTPVLEKAGEKVTPVLEKAGEKVTPVLEKAGEKVTPVLNKAGEKMAPVLDKGKEKVTPVLEKAGEKVTPMLDKGKEKMAPILDKAGDKAKNIGGAVTGAFKGFLGKKKSDSVPKEDE